MLPLASTCFFCCHRTGLDGDNIGFLFLVGKGGNAQGRKIALKAGIEKCLIDSLIGLIEK